jgi:hypothetical protein
MIRYIGLIVTHIYAQMKKHKKYVHFLYVNKN